MGDVNLWLLALAFGLGVVLTAALTIRRVPAALPGARASGGAASFAGGRSGAESETPTTATDESAPPKAPDDGP